MVEPGLPAHQRHVNSIFITGFSMDDVSITIFVTILFEQCKTGDYLLHKEL